MFAGMWVEPLLAHFGRDWSSGLQAARMVLPATSGEASDWREQILGCHVSSVSAALHGVGRMVLMEKGDSLDFGFHGLVNRAPTADQDSGQERGWG